MLQRNIGFFCTLWKACRDGQAPPPTAWSPPLRVDGYYLGVRRRRADLETRRPSSPWVGLKR
ncbi:hypothetical protein J2S64_002826 [Paeniglutamicibacter sulfureus]|uniref:Uncharacterized protein n=1 Tax=Paeniglutamicibacter sulfureus TaxID=43666 RepID=A0ABU2BKG8_9MICC|nr:hypothetical protein [Paeniglutamicibacter sulfureus]